MTKSDFEKWFQKQWGDKPSAHLLTQRRLRVMVLRKALASAENALFESEHCSFAHQFALYAWNTQKGTIKE